MIVFCVTAVCTECTDIQSLTALGASLGARLGAQGGGDQGMISVTELSCDQIWSGQRQGSIPSDIE